MENTTKIAVGLDIGTTKITVIIGRKNEHGKIEIMGMGKAPSTGVMRGIVANIDKTTQSINKALEEAISSSGLNVKNVNVGMAAALPDGNLIVPVIKECQNNFRSFKNISH